MAPDIGGRVARRDDRHRRRLKLAGVAGAGLLVVVLVVGGILLLNREDDTTHRAASTSRHVTTSSSTSTSTSTTAAVATTVVPRSPNPVVALAQQYDGYYTGMWTNQTFGTKGPATLEVRIDPNANTLTSKASFDGDLFGGGAKLPRDIESTINIGDPNAPVMVQTKEFGTVTARIDSTLALILDAPDVPDPKVKSFSLTGRLNSSRNGFDATYTVVFENGKTANGIMNVACASTGQRPSQVQTLCTP